MTSLAFAPHSGERWAVTNRRRPPAGGTWGRRRRLGMALERTGFVRVDLIGRGDDQRFVVSLFSAPRYPIDFWAKPKLLSRWSVRLDETLRRELAAAH